MCDFGNDKHDASKNRESNAWSLELSESLATQWSPNPHPSEGVGASSPVPQPACCHLEDADTLFLPPLRLSETLSEE